MSDMNSSENITYKSIVSKFFYNTKCSRGRFRLLKSKLKYGAKRNKTSFPFSIKKRDSPLPNHHGKIANKNNEFGIFYAF